MTHTPGSWNLSGPFGINDYDEREGSYRVWAGRTLFLTVARCPDGYREGENVANAHLIAAAPDLLAALEQVAEYPAIMLTFEPETRDAINAAIAKARNTPSLHIEVL